MAQFFSSGLVIDVILVLVVVEGIAMTILYRTRGSGVPPHEFALNLVSGACLMLAVREALVGAPWWIVSACMGAALVAHGADLARRWR